MGMNFDENPEKTIRHLNRHVARLETENAQAKHTIAEQQARIAELECALSTKEMEFKELCQHYDKLKIRTVELENMCKVRYGDGYLGANIELAGEIALRDDRIAELEAAIQRHRRIGSKKPHDDELYAVLQEQSDE
jgi:predicted RNase H-like nuclease (RuvC/YqgF family)